MRIDKTIIKVHHVMMKVENISHSTRGTLNMTLDGNKKTLRNMVQHLLMLHDVGSMSLTQRIIVQPSYI